MLSSAIVFLPHARDGVRRATGFAPVDYRKDSVWRELANG
jgi:hypothetical protein